jgi:hypothetical protein
MSPLGFVAMPVSRPLVRTSELILSTTEYCYMSVVVQGDPDSAKCILLANRVFSARFVVR